jgi:hypothetical protein
MCLDGGRLHTDFGSIHPDIQGCKVASPAGRQKFVSEKLTMSYSLSKKFEQGFRPSPTGN